ncbi:hypothetical protein TRIP_E230064 [uncultured Spirochaetota bacterium]|nr:hypothetical protein TRIP_E230064 [uncultured Spirochaetota bacterium]
MIQSVKTIGMFSYLIILILMYHMMVESYDNYF